VKRNVERRRPTNIKETLIMAKKETKPPNKPRTLTVQGRVIPAKGTEDGKRAIKAKGEAKDEAGKK